MATASDQLARLLSLVPWLRAHPGVSKAEAAAAFAISVDQLEKDLQLAFTCELPGQPEVFIDIDYLDSDRVSVIDAGSIDRPLRLRADEAVSLLVGLRSLAAVPGLADRAALDSALAKIEDAAARVGVGLGPDTTALRAGAARHRAVTRSRRSATGLAQGHRVHLGYWVPSRDEVTERDVDPFRVFSRRRHRLPRGVLPRLRGRPHVPAGPGHARRGPAGAGRRSRRRAPDRVREPAAVFHPSDQDTVVVLDLEPRGALGARVLRLRVGPARPRTLPRGPCGWLCGPPTHVSWSVWSCGWGAPRGWSSPRDVAEAVRRAADEALVAYGVSSTAD